LAVWSAKFGDIPDALPTKQPFWDRLLVFEDKPQVANHPGFSVTLGIILIFVLSTQWRLAVCTTHRLVPIEIRWRGGESCSRIEVGPRSLHHQCQCGSSVDARVLHSFGWVDLALH